MRQMKCSGCCKRATHRVAPTMISVFAILFTLQYFSHYFVGSTSLSSAADFCFWRCLNGQPFPGNCSGKCGDNSLAKQEVKRVIMLEGNGAALYQRLIAAGGQIKGIDRAALLAREARRVHGAAVNLRFDQDHCLA